MSGWQDCDYASDGKDVCCRCGHVARRGERVFIQVQGHPGYRGYSRECLCRRCYTPGGRLVSYIAKYEPRLRPVNIGRRGE